MLLPPSRPEAAPRSGGAGSFDIAVVQGDSILAESSFTPPEIGLNGRDHGIFLRPASVWRATHRRDKALRLAPLAQGKQRKQEKASERSERASGAERAAKRAPASDAVGS
jgi:hypothetical protein